MYALTAPLPPPPQLRDGPTFGLYFTAYEASKGAIAAQLSLAWPGAEHLGLMASLPAGAIAGAASWAVALPADVVKSNIQGAPLTTPMSALRIAAVAGRIWREDGSRGFFRGFVPCVLRSLPVNAATFFLLESLRALKRRHEAAQEALA
jgi:solute carrier family 25 carnitine/acylcarnitine transporter 20/29